MTVESFTGAELIESAKVAHDACREYTEKAEGCTKFDSLHHYYLEAAKAELKLALIYAKEIKRRRAIKESTNA